jgi:hypothetical protein
MKRVLGTLQQSLKEYYLYLVRECLSSLSRAEDYYSMHMYSSCDRMLFQAAEFFWKSLVVLSGSIFDRQHETPMKEFSKISDDILKAEDKAQLFKILSELPNSRRELAIYGYTERGKLLVTPDKILQPDDVAQDLDRVRRLVEALRRIHLCQMSDPPIRIGVLSGYVNEPAKEKPCQAYPYSTFRSASQWIDDLKMSYKNPNEMFPSPIGDLFVPVEISIAELGSGFYPIVINPFGECFPEKGQGRGVALETILEYIRDGGIFVNSAGHPFIYTWDVDAPSDNQRQLVSYINVVTGIEVKKINEKQFEIFAKGGAKFPGDALILITEFKVAAAWDLPTVTGPHEVEIRYSEKLKRTFSGLARVFRPIVADGPCNIIPLVVTDDKAWGDVHPVAAIPYGRGFLISCGMSLQEEREYKILLDIIQMLTRNGLDSLLSAKS